MSSFVVVRSADDLSQACASVSALTRQIREAATAAPDPLLGIWIEHAADPGPDVGLLTPSELARNPALCVQTSTELAGLWGVYWTSPITRGCLTHALVASVAATNLHQARFLPVFPVPVSDWRTEWAALAARHRSRVLPPIFQEMDGTVSLGLR